MCVCVYTSTYVPVENDELYRVRRLSNGNINRYDLHPNRTCRVHIGSARYAGHVLFLYIVTVKQLLIRISI